MPEDTRWKAHIRRHLPPLHLAPERELEIIEELAQQMESAYLDALASGAAEEQAVERAQSQVGDWNELASSLRAAEHEASPTPRPKRSLGLGLGGDLRFALRTFTKNPGFAATAILTLALGIGGCVAIYTLLDAVVLRPLDYRDPDRLVMVWEQNFPRDRKENVVSPANYLDWKARNRVFSAMSPVANWSMNLTGSGEPEEIRAHFVGPDFLSMLGVEPVVGRNLSQADAKPGAERVVLLGHAFWMRRFGGDSSIIGRKLTLDAEPMTVIGVLPAGFLSIGTEPSVVAILPIDPAHDYRRNSGRFLMTIARLGDGITFTRAQDEMSALARQLEKEYPNFNKGWGVQLVPLQDHFAGKARSGLWILMGAVGLVLLIACTNVANLLLVRAAVREREIAIRSALGASSARIVRQLLAESVLLAGFGGALGCGVAYWLVKALRAIAPVEVPRLDSAAIDWQALGFALLLTTVTGIFFGTAPAIAALRSDVQEGLRDGSRGASRGPRAQRMRAVLVTAQVALSCVLLVGAGLLLRSFSRLLSTDPGFATTNVLTMRISIAGPRAFDPQTTPRLFQELMDQARTLPGVEAASAITYLPFTGPGAATSYFVEGGPEALGGDAEVTDVRMVAPELFETMRIPLKRGRLFDANDHRPDAPLRFVVSETMARDAYPNDNPLGRRLRVRMGEGREWGEIIGVVGDIRTASLAGQVRPMVYYPMAKLPFGWGTLVIRTQGDPNALVQPMLAAIRERYPDQPVSDIKLMSDWVSRSLRQQRFLALLLSGLAALSLLLAAVGLYGMLSYSVAQRTREIGVRLALGADPAKVRLEVMAAGVRLAVMGLVAGAAVAAVLSPVLKPALEDVTLADPASYAAAIAVFVTVAALATAIPAHRATRVDPVVALRDE